MFYDRYQRGFCQQVYSELFSLGERIYEEQALYREAVLVMRELMRRVRRNSEVLSVRLSTPGYMFGKGGYWEIFSVEDRKALEEGYRSLQPPSPTTREQLVHLENLAGTLPLALTCWYEEVGAVNFVGLFPSWTRASGSIVDPLWINPLETVLQSVESLTEHGTDMSSWQEDPFLILSPDKYHKYGYSGGGTYEIYLPCRAIDTVFLQDGGQERTFVEYLRVCFRWAGFPGLEENAHLPEGVRLPRETMIWLTQALLPF